MEDSPVERIGRDAMRVIIVEDEPMLAFHLEDELAEAGHLVVASVMTGAEAEEAGRAVTFDLALIDVRLADGATGIRAAARLAAEGAMVVFLTASADELPDDFAGAFGVIEKPFSPRGLRSALQFLNSVRGDGAPPPPPVSLRLAPGSRTGPGGLYRFGQTNDRARRH